MATIEQNMMKMMMAVMMASIMMTIVGSTIPAPPTLSYCCPLEAGVCFATLAELEAHFTATHPTIDISIVWQ